MEELVDTIARKKKNRGAAGEEFRIREKQNGEYIHWFLVSGSKRNMIQARGHEAEGGEEIFSKISRIRLLRRTMALDL